jgi:hypothetical protein
VLLRFTDEVKGTKLAVAWISDIVWISLIAFGSTPLQEIGLAGFAVSLIFGVSSCQEPKRHLKTRWFLVSHPAGRQLAVRSPNNRVTGWPHSAVKKRIDAGEHDFFATVYESLRRSVQETYAD